LTLKLKECLQYLETNLAHDLVKELEPRILNALKDCLPDQVQSQIASSPAIASKIAKPLCKKNLLHSKGSLQRLKIPQRLQLLIPPLN
jgi:hypothetical protein